MALPLGDGGAGLPLGEAEGRAVPLAEGASAPLDEAVTDAEAPLDSEAVGVPVPEGVAVVVGGGLAAGVALLDAELVLVMEGDANRVRVAVGEPEVVEEALRVELGVSNPVPDADGVGVPVGVALGDGVGVALPL